MLPEGFIQRIKGQRNVNSEALVKALKEPSPVSIRMNPSKWNRSPLNSEPVPWCKYGYYLGIRPSYTLDPLFHAGCYYPQEASGMFLEQVIRQTVNTNEKIRVLDLCGAPGGKSTHLSHLIGPDNLLVTNEVIRSRAVILAETMNKWGSGNTLVTQNDPAMFGKLSGYFDLILVDAPCSGEGMFRSKIAVDEWSLDNAAHCSERQKRILMDVWPALKGNGILIYSTCTFNPAENEENIKWLTEKQDAECLSINIEGFKGIAEIDYQGIYGYGFYPGLIRGEGFFISAIRKRSMQKKIYVKRSMKDELIPDKNDAEIACRWTSFSKERVLKWGNEHFALPCGMEDYLFLFNNLKIVKAGTKLFVVKKNDYLPSHELALSDHVRNSEFSQVEVNLQEAIAYLRRDSFPLMNATRGWNILKYKGVNIGFINNIGTRVNNYFPVEWRIRMNIPEAGKENIIDWNND